MKPTAKHDFPVTVSSERDEHPAELAPLYDAIFEVQLNRTVSFYVMPQFSRDPWPPRTNEHPSTQSGACRNLAAAARLSITPSSIRERSNETFTDEDGDAHTLLYVSEEQYASLDAELRKLAESDEQVRLVSMVLPVLQDIILNRIVNSGVPSSYALSMLGREMAGSVK